MSKIHHYFIEDGPNFIPVSFEVFEQFRNLLTQHDVEYDFIHRSWFCGSQFKDSQYMLCKVSRLSDSAKWFSLIQSLDLNL